MSITREAKAKRSKSNNIKQKSNKKSSKKKCLPEAVESMTGSSDSDSARVYYAGGKGKD